MLGVVGSQFCQSAMLSGCEISEIILVLVISKFDEDPSKIETASLETSFPHYKSMGNVLDAQGHLTPKGVVRSGRNSNSSEILCLFSLPASFDKDQIKTEVVSGKTTVSAKFSSFKGK